MPRARGFEGRTNTFNTVGRVGRHVGQSSRAAIRAGLDAGASVSTSLGEIHRALWFARPRSTRNAKSDLSERC
jgi:hypothetical protein